MFENLTHALGTLSRAASGVSCLCMLCDVRKGMPTLSVRVSCGVQIACYVVGFMSPYALSYMYSTWLAERKEVPNYLEFTLSLLLFISTFFLCFSFSFALVHPFSFLPSFLLFSFSPICFSDFQFSLRFVLSLLALFILCLLPHSLGVFATKSRNNSNVSFIMSACLRAFNNWEAVERIFTKLGIKCCC